MTKEASNKPRAGETGYVGPGHPPAEHRIKPGEKRNPWGRKGKPKPGVSNEFEAELAEALTQPVTSKTGEQLAPAQVVAKAMISGVIRGDFRYLELYLKYVSKFSVKVDKEEVELDSSYDALLRETLERMVQERLALLQVSSIPEERD